MKVQRNPRSPYITAVRPMVKADIESLREPSARPRIDKLSAAHRTMVRLFALGYTTSQVADQLGYSAARVSLIRNSPAFQEQLSRFLDAADEHTKKCLDATIDLMDQGRVLAANGMLERLESGELSDAMLVKYFDTFADRTNYHRKTTKENININFAAQLEAAITRSREVRYIDVEPGE